MEGGLIGVSDDNYLCSEVKTGWCGEEGCPEFPLPTYTSATTTDLDVKALEPERDKAIPSVIISLVCVKCDGD